MAVSGKPGANALLISCHSLYLYLYPYTTSMERLFKLCLDMKTNAQQQIRIGEENMFLSTYKYLLNAVSQIQ